MKFIGPNGEPNSVDLRCATDFETLLEAAGWASRVLIGAESAFFAAIVHSLSFPEVSVRYPDSDTP